MTEARGANRGHIWALGLPCDDRLVRNSFVGVTLQNRREGVLGGSDGNASPDRRSERPHR